LFSVRCVCTSFSRPTTTTTLTYSFQFWCGSKGSPPSSAGLYIAADMVFVHEPCMYRHMQTDRWKYLEQMSTTAVLFLDEIDKFNLWQKLQHKMNLVWNYFKI
jgi:hypothetical protein